MKDANMRKQQNFNRRHILTLAVFPMLNACSADMQPKRPYSLPIDLTKAGSQAVFEIESLVPELGVGIELVFHFQNEKQRAELLDKVEMRVANPSRPLALDNPHIGIVVPLRVLFKSENSTLYDDLRQTKEAFSASAKTPGVVNRIVYGRVVPKGKYSITVTNMQAQPEFAGYRTELKIAGDRKV